MLSKSLINFHPKRNKLIFNAFVLKAFCNKPELKFIKPKYYADINKITPPENYNENYKLKFG